MVGKRGERAPEAIDAPGRQRRRDRSWPSPADVRCVRTADVGGTAPGARRTRLDGERYALDRASSTDALRAGPSCEHRLEPSAGVAHPSRALQAGERHRRLGDARPNPATTWSSVDGLGATALEHGGLDARGSGRGSNPGRPARRWSSPSASSTSAASVTGVAPSRSSWLVPAAARLLHRARDRHHLDRALERLTCRGERSASLTALDDHEHLAERGEDAVAQREPELLGRRARRPLRQQQAVAPPPPRHSSACWRGYGRSSPLATTPTAWPVPAPQGAAVGGAVDALGEPGHDDDVGGGELATEREGEVTTRRRWRCACRRCRRGGGRGRPAPPGEEDGRRLRVGRSSTDSRDRARSRRAMPSWAQRSGPARRVALARGHGATPRAARRQHRRRRPGAAGDARAPPPRPRPGRGGRGARAAAPPSPGRDRRARRGSRCRRRRSTPSHRSRPARPAAARRPARSDSANSTSSSIDPVVVAGGEVGDRAGDPADAVVARVR